MNTPSLKLKFNRKAFTAKSNDILPIAFLTCGLIYLTFTDSFTMGIIATVVCLFLAASQLAKMLPAVEKHFKHRISFWHVATIGMIITIVLSTFEPAHALFLQDLENKITTIVAGTSSSIPASSIALIFNLLRVIFVLMIVASAIYAYVQAQQGNDARPVITSIVIALAVIMAVDVLTVLVAGT